jgi:hypothetical protein
MVDSRAQSKRPGGHGRSPRNSFDMSGLPKSSNIHLLLFFLFATLDLIIFASMPMPIKKGKFGI